MTRDKRIMNVALEDAVIQAMLEELERRDGMFGASRMNPSDFIRSAIMEKLSHLKRARKQKKVWRFTCDQCGQSHDASKVGYYVKPLFGHKEYVCVYCVRVRPTSI